MAKYTIQTPRGNKVTVEADTPEAATAGAQKWDLEDFATKEATRLGLDPSIALRQMQHESGSNPNAVSPKGARGPMQLMPDTAKGLGVDPNDPYQNITGGLTYYAKLKKQYNGDDRMALAAYNGGPGNVAKYGGIPPFKETQKYVNTILGPASSPAPPRQPGGMDRGTGVPVTMANLQRTMGVKPNATADAGKSFLSGLTGALGGMADQVQTAAVGVPLGMLQQAAGLASGKPVMPQPLGLNASIAARNAHVPQTTAGQWAKTAGEMVPNAIFPGSAAARLANVVLPTVGAEGAAQAVKAFGGGDQAQSLARTVGGVAGGLATGIRPGVRAARAQPQTLEQVDKGQRAAWDAVDASGYRFPQQDVQSAAGDIRNIVNEAGPDLYENSAKIANRVEDLAGRGDLTPAQANRLRSQIGEKLLKPGSDEASVGRQIQARIDALIDTGSEASPLLKDARAKYTQFMKMKDVSQRLEDAGINQAASGTGGNPNAVRQALKPLVKNKSAQRMRNATPDEMAALKSVVNGTPTQNAMRALSAFDPFHSRLGMLLQTVLSVKTAGLSAATIPAGMAATAADKAIGASNLQKVLDLISTGGKKTAQPLLSYSPQFPALAAALPGLSPLLAPQAALAAQASGAGTAKDPRKRPSR